MKRAILLQTDKPLISGCFLAFAGLVQFLIFTSLSMGEYPGGTIADSHTTGYTWMGNWLSDLGRQTAINGMENRLGASYFNGSIIALGICLLIFFLASIRAFEEQTFVGVLTVGAGLFASMGLIGIGLAPVDVAYQWHIVSLLAWIIPMLGYGALFTYQCSVGESWYSLIIATATVVLFLGAGLYAFSVTNTNVMAAQKTVVLLSIAWFILLAGRISLAAFYVSRTARTRLQMANEQAADYLVRIRNQHSKGKRQEDWTA